MSIDNKIAELLEETKTLHEETVDSKTVDDSKFTDSDKEYDMSDAIAALTEGENLTEEFKTKAAVIFEAAVMERVRSEVEKIEETFEQRLDEEVENIKDDMVEKIDGYLDYVVEQWSTDNEIALENGLKNEILENFITGLKGLFEDHYVEVPEERYDLVDEMANKIRDTEEKLNEQFEANIEFSKQLAELKKDIAIREACVGMTAINADKLRGLAEELSFESAEAFKAKLQTLKESYFSNKKSDNRLVESFITNNPPVDALNEDSSDEQLSGTMAQYLRTLRAHSK